MSDMGNMETAAQKLGVTADLLRSVLASELGISEQWSVSPSRDHDLLGGRGAAEQQAREWKAAQDYCVKHDPEHNRPEWQVSPVPMSRLASQWRA